MILGFSFLIFPLFLQGFAFQAPLINVFSC